MVSGRPGRCVHGHDSTLSLNTVSEEADNLILKLLREMRADMATKSDLGEVRREVSDVRHDVGDLRHDVSEGFTAITKALSDVRLGDRLTSIEKRLTDLERRRGS